ncbi:hypothetical protein CLU79DRAFT_759884 [Phycomyces nitens]|nr:hypothetical protein CLU79DRAFT_759884 [Phycomyces nitens]
MSLTNLDVYLESYQIALIDDSNPNKGRCIVALEPLSRGSVITTSQPLATITLEANRNEFCNYCFKKPQSMSPNVMPLQRCTQCRAAYFCNVDCFKNAWLGYHQFVCKSLAKSPPEDSETLDAEMLERVALNVGRYSQKPASDNNGLGEEGERQDETVDVTMEAFLSLMGHVKEQPKHVLNKYKRIADMVLKKPYISSLGLSQERLVEFLCWFQCNNFSIQDSQMFTIGEGTYPVASLFNHSCRPNAVVIFDGALLTIKAIVDIPSGEEVTIAYIDAAHSRSVRQKTLREKYFFDCDCVRCTDNTFFGQIDSLLGEEESDWDRAQRVLDPSKAKNDLRKEILKQVDADGWDLLEMCRIYDRKSNCVPEPSKPLTMSTFAHCFVQFFSPYLWSYHNPRLLITSPSPHSYRAQVDRLEDPQPPAARPPVRDTADEILSTSITLALSYPTYPGALIPYRLTTLAAATSLFYDEMADGEWENAVKLGMYIIIQYCFIYPQYHPIVAQHLLMLSKASWNSIVKLDLLNNGRALDKLFDNGFRRWIALSKETIQSTFGKQSDQWREVLELEWIFMREQKLK